MSKVHVHLTNRIATLLPPYKKRKLLKEWSYSVPGFRFMRGKYPGWDGRKKFLLRNRVPAGLFHATRQDLEKEGIKFKVNFTPQTIPMRSSKHWIKSEGKYDFQNQCVDAMQAALSTGGGLILNATGSGKTRIAAMFASRIDTDMLFVVDQINLLDQARADIKKHLGESIGKVGESKFKLRRVTVATRQTLAKHLKHEIFRIWFERVQIIIVDEIHEMLGKSNFDIIHEASPFAVFGLTATLGLKRKPVRLKAYALCGPKLYEYPVTQGMEENVLSKGIVTQLLYNNSVRETNAYSSEEIYKDRVVKNGERNAIISRIVARSERNNRYCIVLVERLKHLSELSYALEKYEIPHKIIAGTFRGEHVKKEERLRFQKKFEKGKVKVILANKVMKKGVNLKRVDLIIDAAARKSKEDAVQKFGRGVRLHPDKGGLIYIDISDQDKYDKHRPKSDKQNPLRKAAISRRRAFLAAGIPIYQFPWDEDMDERSQVKLLFRKAEKWLRKEINKKQGEKQCWKT